MGSPYEMRLLSKQLLLFAFIGISLAVPLTNKNAKKIFNSIDANGNGYITRDQTMKLVDTVFLDIKLQLEQSIFGEFDADRNRKLNFEEFSNLMKQKDALESRGRYMFDVDGPFTID